MKESIEIKQKRVLNAFLENPTLTIIDISKITNIPKSTVQRYLNKYDNYILPNEKITIKEQLMKNKRKGQSKGGNNSYLNNDTLRDDRGRFIKVVKTNTDKNTLIKKQNDIKNLGDILISNNLNDLNQYTDTYIHELLNDKKLDSIIGKKKINRIISIIEKDNLKEYTTLNEKNILPILDNTKLNDLEKLIVLYRVKKYKQKELEEKTKLNYIELLLIERKSLLSIKDNKND